MAKLAMIKRTYLVILSMKGFGDRLRGLRKQQKMTQSDLGQTLRVGGENISRYEIGLSIPPSDKLLRLAKFFRVSTDYLLQGDVLDVASVEIDDVELLNLFLKVCDLSNEDKSTIKNVLRSFTEK